MDRNVRRSLLDWGACHRLLDHIELDSDNAALLPRVRLLVDFWVAHNGGWPGGKPPEPDRFVAAGRDPLDRKKKRKRARKSCA